MLDDKELAQLCRQLGLSEQAQLVIQNIRSSPPARRVRSAGGNVSVRYPSRKMGVVIQAESHRNELAGIFEMEHDANTLEYYDQPSPIKLEYRAKSGRRVGVLHTPDFFVIRTDAVGWEEWKMENELVRLAERMPHRYVREDEEWRCPPGERHAGQFGFFYRVRSSAGINWVFQRNIVFLEDYLRGDEPTVDEKAKHAILTLVADEPGIRLDELLRQGAPASSDDVYALIATDQVYVDLYAVPLAEPDRVPVFLDEQVARAYSTVLNTPSRTVGGRPPAVHIATGVTVLWDNRPWTIANTGETTTTLLAEDGTLVDLPNATFEALIKQGRLCGPKQEAPEGIGTEARELLAQASPDALREANRRYTIIRPVLHGRPPEDDTVAKRTIRDWASRYREAEQAHGCGYIGLLSRHHRKGNRGNKLPENTMALQQEFIKDNYETIKQKSMLSVYGQFVKACEERGVVAPSYKTFTRAVKSRPRYEQTRKRQGRRAAYDYEPTYWELKLTTPRHGDRPFEIGHIDHTELDIELVCSCTGCNLGRPWVTFLVDAFSRRLLAVHLTFDPPSYRSCMMVLRECVRRHGRFPQILVVDGGAEFNSAYFETLLARYECIKKTRPPARPRFGSVCERLFGTANSQFVHNLIGNTQITTLVRQVTKSVDPKRHAVWTLHKLHAYLCEWAYEVYDTIEHPALGQSPREAFAAGLLQSGVRSRRLIPYDQDFVMFILPTTQKGTAKVQPNHGVKINYIYYWSDAFRNREVESTQVPVRYDPFDVGTAHAYVNGRWVRCISEHYVCFVGRSEREMKLAAEELRKRNRQHAKRFVVTARKLADFVTSVEAEELLLGQRLRDAENKSVSKATNNDGPSNTAEVPSSEPDDTQGEGMIEPKCTQTERQADEDGTLQVYGEY
jgi:putative transposase